MAFQEKYNLNVNRKLNDETLELIIRPGCLVGENNFWLASKWNKTQLGIFLKH